MEEDEYEKESKKEKSQAVTFESVVEKASNHVQDDEVITLDTHHRNLVLEKEFKEFEEWMRSLGGGLDKFISQYTYELGARSLQDIADFMSDESTIRKTMTMLNEKQIGIFVKAAGSLKDKLKVQVVREFLFLFSIDSVFHRHTPLTKSTQTHRYVQKSLEDEWFRWVTLCSFRTNDITVMIVSRETDGGPSVGLPEFWTSI